MKLAESNSYLRDVIGLLAESGAFEEVFVNLKKKKLILLINIHLIVP